VTSQPARAATEAKRLLESAAPHDPILARALAEAFDEAWAIIALRVLPEAHLDIHTLRFRLVHAVLANAKHCGADVPALVSAAVSDVLPQMKEDIRGK
jgi:hypothetical protein